MPGSGDSSRRRCSHRHLLPIVITVLLVLNPLLIQNVTAAAGTFSPPHDDFGQDTDVPPDGLFNYLVIDVSLSITEGGSFIIEGDLYAPDNSHLGYVSEPSSLPVGIHIVQIKFNGVDIAKSGKDGPYRVELALWFGFTLLDTDTHYTQAYMANQFQVTRAMLYPPHSDSGVDLNGNSKYDILAVDVKVKVNVSSELKLKGNLYDNGETELFETKIVIKQLPVGIQTIRLNFTGFLIYDSNKNGPYKVRLWLYDQDGYTLSTGLHSTNSYLYTDFEQPPASLSPPHTELPLDLNQPLNSLYDYFVIITKINVNKAGTYSLEGELWQDAVNPAFIAYTTNTSTLSTGLKNVWLHFLGWSIKDSNINGKYRIYLRIYDVNGTITSAGEHLTGNYNAANFDELPAVFNPPHSDFGLDTDVPKNGLYNYLVVNASLSVRITLTYRVRSNLWNNAETAFINATRNNTLLTSGPKVVPLWFDGYKIYNSTYSGPYVAKMYMNDQFGNALNTSRHTTSAYPRSKFDHYVPPDSNPPSISDMKAEPNPQELNLNLKLSAIVTDDTGVQLVRANITNPLGQYLGSFAMTFNPTSGRYESSSTYSTLGTYTYIVWAVDDAGKTATSPPKNFQIIDTTKPSISSIQVLPNPQEVHGSVNISAIVTDNNAVSTVKINIAGLGNFTMGRDLPSGRYYDIRTYNIIGIYTYVFWASDPSGNWRSATGNFNIRDSTSPLISGLQVDPKPQEVSSSVNVSAIATDNYAISGVWLDVSGIGNFSMSRDPMTGRYYLSRQYNDIGTHPFKLWAKDGASNWAFVADTIIMVDSSPPAISGMTVVPPEPRTGMSVNISALVTDNYALSTVWIKVIDPLGGIVTDVAMAEDPVTGRYYHVESYALIGTHAVTISATDSVGLITYGYAWFNVTDAPDFTPPVIQTHAAIPNPQDVNLALRVNAIVTDNVGLSIVMAKFTSPSGGDLGNVSMSYDGLQYYREGNFTAQGVYNYCIWAVDTSGNGVNAYGQFTITDMSPPVLTNVKATPNPQQVNGNVRISVSVTDNIGVSLVRAAVTSPTGIDLGNVTMSYDGLVYFREGNYMEQGVHDYCVWAEDAKGNGVRGCGQFTIVSGNLPVITDHYATPNPQEVNTNVRIYASMIGNVVNRKAKVISPTGVNLGNVTMSFDGSMYYRDGSYGQLGTYDYCIWADDGGGNGAKACGQFLVHDTTDPSISMVEAIPNPQEIHLEVELRAVVSDNHQVETVSVEVRSPDGSTLGNFTMSLDPPSGRYVFKRAYDDIGVYQYTVMAWDVSGNLGVVPGSFMTLDTIDPMAVAGPDKHVIVGDVVTFDGSGSMDNDKIANFTWIFNDGATPRALYQKVSVYSFTNIGTYPVSLTVTDRSGNTASDTLVVTVSSAGPSPPRPPTDVVISIKGSDSLALSWTAPTEHEDGSPLLTLSGFDIYRSTAPGPPYIRINTAQITETIYFDSGLERGVAYYYAVKAIESGGMESAYSLEVMRIIPTLGSINGKVIDGNLAPISGALVTLSKGTSTLATMFTDSQGLFSFEDLNGGEYVLGVSKSGFLPKDIQVTVISGTATDLDPIMLQRESQTQAEGVPLTIIFIAVPIVIVALVLVLLRKRASNAHRRGQDGLRKDIEDAGKGGDDTGT